MADFTPRSVVEGRLDAPETTAGKNGLLLVYRRGGALTARGMKREEAKKEDAAQEDNLLHCHVDEGRERVIYS
jgi:hypothetical protein